MTYSWQTQHRILSPGLFHKTGRELFQQRRLLTSFSSYELELASERNELEQRQVQ